MFELSLDVCGDDEFNCDNGECVLLEDRCNGRQECQVKDSMEDRNVR